MRAGNTPRTRPSCRKCERTLALALHPRPARRCIIQQRPAHFPKLAAEHTSNGSPAELGGSFFAAETAPRSPQIGKLPPSLERKTIQ